LKQDLTFPTCGIRLLSLDDRGLRVPSVPPPLARPASLAIPRLRAPAPPLRLGDDYGCYRTPARGFLATGGRPKSAQNCNAALRAARVRVVDCWPDYSPAAMAKPMSTGLA